MNPSVVRLGFPAEDVRSITHKVLRAATPTVKRGNLRLLETLARARALVLPVQNVNYPFCVRLGFLTEDLLSVTLQDLRAATPTVERGNLRLPEALAAARALHLTDQNTNESVCNQVGLPDRGPGKHYAPGPARR